MFDMLKNLGDLPSLMAKARQMQEQMERVQEELKRKTVSADAAAGLVTATVNGRLELVKLRIDRDRLKLPLTAPEGLDMLEDVICAAVAAAQTKAAAVMQEEMGKVAGGLGLPPGMKLPGM